jgi:hypothetical protein
MQLSDSVVLSVVQADIFRLDVYCAYGSAHTFYYLHYIKPSLILHPPTLNFEMFGLG